MTTFNYTNILTQAVDELSESQSYKGLFHQHKDGDPLPSAKSLYKIVELARAIIFPGYFGNSTVNSHTINYHIGVNVEIEQMDFATLMSRMLDGEHDLGIIGSGGTLDPSESREMIYPESSCNFCQLQDTELSDLIDKGNAEDRKSVV